jgi:hypothetical protein
VHDFGLFGQKLVAKDSGVPMFLISTQMGKDIQVLYGSELSVKHDGRGTVCEELRKFGPLAPDKEIVVFDFDGASSHAR